MVSSPTGAYIEGAGAAVGVYGKFSTGFGLVVGTESDIISKIM